jgi:NADH dehydrogenase [ubiquinone] 1 alpha subcomplex assembly factor 5
MDKKIFDFRLLVKNQQRYLKNFSKHNFLFKEIADLIVENLQFFNREFEEVLEVNSRDGYLSNSILKVKKVKKLYKSNFVADFFNLDLNIDQNIEKILLKDEFLPPLDQKFDLIVSNLNFHFLNNIPQFLLQVKDSLKPQGVFIASFFGQDNLLSIREIFYKAESKIYNGISPRFAPTIDVKTAAHLLQKAGFVNPISDLEKITVTYPNLLALLQELKLMGQSNIMIDRSKRFISKRFLAYISQLYEQKYHDEKSKGIKADFEIITLIGSN